MRAFAPLLLIIAAAAPSSLAAQNVPTTRYDRAEARFPEPLSLIAGFRALNANRAIVSDPLEGRITLLNWADGSLTDIGRQGGGPGEYGAPGALFASGDGTLMMDMANRRLVPIEEDRIGQNTISLGSEDGLPIFARGVDARGNVYHDLAGIASPATAEYARQGRAPLMRWNPATNRTDTLGMVNFPPLPAAGPGEMRVQIGGSAYQPRDAWAVAADGRVAVVRANPYRVEWLGGATTVMGPEIAYRPIPVGEAEKNAYADQMAQRGMMMTMDNGRRTSRRAPRPDINRITWPETMPAFAASVFMTASNELWVERSRSARETARTYDVFNTQGQRERQVVFPAGQRVLAIGSDFIITSITDDDGLEWVERFRL